MEVNGITDEYVAGFFDGEGCIQLTVGDRIGVKGKTYLRCQLYISITQLDPTVLYAIKDVYGGNVYKRKARATKSSKMHNRSDWVATSKVAADFLEDIRPYMICKAEEADIALKFASTMGNNTQDTRNGLAPEVIALRKQLCADIKSARQRKTDQAYDA